MRLSLSVAVVVSLALSARFACADVVPVVRTTLDSAGDVGRSNDVAVLPGGLAVVAYTDDTAATLKVAACQDAACTAAAIATVDAGGPFSLVAAAIGADGLPLVAYRHAASSTVRLARCADAGCTTAGVEVVGGISSSAEGIGLSVGGDGFPALAYRDGLGLGLAIAHCTDAGCADATVTHHTGGGSDPDLLAGSDGLPVYAVRDGVDLVVGRCTSAACTASTTTRIVGSSTPGFMTIYSSPSLVLGADGLVDVVADAEFQFGPNFSLSIVRRRCVDATCSALSSTNTSLATGIRGAAAVRSNGFLAVSHFSFANQGPAIAWCRTAECTSTYKLDLDGAGHDEPTSVGVAAGDVVLTSYYDETNGDLQVAALTGFSEISIATPVSVAEGDSGTTPVSIEVTRTNASSGPATVHYETSAGTAFAFSDFLPASGDLTFAVGEATKTIVVQVVGETAQESDESFSVALSENLGAVLDVRRSTVIILDDDAAQPPLAIGDVSVVEGDTGQTTAVFQVTFGGTAGATVNFFTAPMTATAGVDYVTTSGTVTFAPGETARTIEVPVFGDLLFEPNETFRVRITGAQGGTIVDQDGLATIVNDDTGASFTIGNATVQEGNGGTAAASFTVVLSPPTNATVQYATVGGTATPGTDFQATSGTLTFTTGATLVVTVPVFGDLAVEGDETFQVVLSNPQGAPIGHGAGLGTILDDDLPEAPVPGQLGHGTAFTSDLAALPGPVADADDLPFPQEAYASYEVVADAVSGDALPLVLERRTQSGAVLQSGTPVGTGTARSLRWHTGAAAASGERVRIAGACGVSCGADDAYRVRAYDTTLRAARFNNAGGQATVLVLQNAGDAPVAATVYLWSGAGTLLGTHEPAAPIAAHGVLVLDTSTVAPGASGSVTVAHDGGYGGLAGKAVAVEPATGLSFDTPLEPRPR